MVEFDPDGSRSVFQQQCETLLFGKIGHAATETADATRILTRVCERDPAVLEYVVNIMGEGIMEYFQPNHDDGDLWEGMVKTEGLHPGLVALALSSLRRVAAVILHVTKNPHGGDPNLN